MTAKRDFEQLGDEIHETRERPSPEFAAALDRRAAGWIAGERAPRPGALFRPRLLVPALGAVAAAAIALAVVLPGDGDDGRGLEVSSTGSQESSAPQAAGAHDEEREERDLGGRAIQGGGQPAVLVTRRVAAGSPVEVTYSVPTGGRATLTLTPQGREADAEEGEVELAAGTGVISIQSDGIEPGPYELRIELDDAELLRTELEVVPAGP